MWHIPSDWIRRKQTKYTALCILHYANESSNSVAAAPPRDLEGGDVTVAWARTSSCSVWVPARAHRQRYEHAHVGPNGQPYITVHAHSLEEPAARRTRQLPSKYFGHVGLSESPLLMFVNRKVTGDDIIHLLLHVRLCFIFLFTNLLWVTGCCVTFWVRVCGPEPDMLLARWKEKKKKKRRLRLLRYLPHVLQRDRQQSSVKVVQFGAHFFFFFAFQSSKIVDCTFKWTIPFQFRQPLLGIPTRVI